VCEVVVGDIIYYYSYASDGDYRCIFCDFYFNVVGNFLEQFVHNSDLMLNDLNSMVDFEFNAWL
jgi:hypothetical protein